MKAINVSKYFAYFFLGLVTLLVVVVMLAFSPLGVKTLVGVANKQEGVSIEGVSGSFYSEVTLNRFSYNNPQIDIAAEQFTLDIGLNCLFVGEACIEKFAANAINITLLENNQEPEAPSEPAVDYIELPIAAFLEAFTVGKLNVYTKAINADKQKLVQLAEINASLSMHKALTLTNFSISEASLYAGNKPSKTPPQVEKTSNSTEHWIKVLKEFEYKPFAIPAVFVPINAKIENITVGKFCFHQAQSICTVKTKLIASIEEQKVNAKFETKPEQQVAASIEVKAGIDLASAFSHDIAVTVQANTALTSKTAKSLRLKLIGTATNTELILSSDTIQNSMISATLNAGIEDEQLPLKIALNVGDFKPVLSNWWPSLEVPISALQLNIDGNIDQYDLNASANLDGKQASTISLNGQLSLRQKRLELRDVETSGDLGELSGRIAANLTRINNQDGVIVDSAFEFDKVQLKPLIPSIDSQLNGSITLLANMTPRQLWGSLNCSEIEGELQGLDLRFICDVNLNEEGLVKVNSFELSQGNNHVKGKGQFELSSGLNTNALVTKPNEVAYDEWVNNTESALDLVINVNDLSSLYSSAGGSINGVAKIQGKVDKPVVAANLKVDGFVFNDLELDSALLDIALDLNKDWQTEINLSANELSQESLLAEQVKVIVSGDLHSHSVAIDLMHPDYSLSHELSGEMLVDTQDWQWSGVWEKGVFTSAFDSFTLESPTSISATQNMASMESNCWLATKKLADTNTTNIDANKKALCIDKAEYSASLTELNATLDYNLNTPLSHYFPEIVSEKSNLPLNTSIDLVYSPEKGIQLDTYTLMTQANLVTSKHNIELVALVANTSLNEQVVQTNVFAGTKSTGAIGFRSNLNLDPENRQHEGQLRIDNFMLSPLQRFLPTVEKLTGIIEGNIAFDGLLTEPELKGELLINDVEIMVDNYPYPITNFNQTITIADKKAEIEGELELGSGSADYSGTLTMFTNDQLFDFNGELLGAGMQIAFDKHELIASPSLKIAVNPSKFSLQGEVTIPNAQITIDELPESAKSPSSDIIIIGKQPEPPVLPIGLDVNIRVLLDPPKLNRVTVKALDLEASLAGDLKVQVIQKQDPETLEFSPLETYVNGSINLLSGSYEAYGQNLQIQKGAIYFNGAPSLPQFDITAIRNPLNTADKVVAGLRISGNPVVPKVVLFSEPNMIQARQLSYLLQGTDLDGGEGTSQNVMLVNALVSFGVGNSENGVNRLGQSLGFESLNLQTAGQGENTQVQLTGRISDNIQVSYGVGLFDQVSEVILRYQLQPQLFLEAKGGANSAVDLFYEWTRGE